MPYNTKAKRVAAWKKWYKKNRRRHIANSKRSEQLRREHARKVIQGKKHNKPCKDCGKPYPYWVMQFDHVRGKKIGDVASMLHKGFSLKVILKEIKKCETVCANCHADRTFKRRHASIAQR